MKPKAQAKANLSFFWQGLFSGLKISLGQKTDHWILTNKLLTIIIGWISNDVFGLLYLCLIIFILYLFLSKRGYLRAGLVCWHVVLQFRLIEGKKNKIACFDLYIGRGNNLIHVVQCPYFSFVFCSSGDISVCWFYLSTT